MAEIPPRLSPEGSIRKGSSEGGIVVIETMGSIVTPDRDSRSGKPQTLYLSHLCCPLSPLLEAPAAIKVFQSMSSASLASLDQALSLKVCLT